jgi:hypothetical protein
LAHFHDGYSLRNIFAFLRQTCSEVNMIFTPENIFIKEEDNSETILVDCQIRMDDLTNYHYEVYDDEGNFIPMVCCGFNTSDMQKATKTVGKKDGIKMYIRREENPNIYIDILHAGSESGDAMGLKFVPILEREPMPYSEITYESKYPNARPPISQFSKFCAEISSLKCTTINVIGFEEGVLIQGFESNIIKNVQTFGDVPISNSNKMTNSNSISSTKPRLNIKFPEEVARICISTLVI